MAFGDKNDFLGTQYFYAPKKDTWRVKLAVQENIAIAAACP